MKLPISLTILSARRTKRLSRKQGTVRQVSRRVSRRVSTLASSGLFLRKIVGTSMSPTYEHGQVVVCWRSQRAQKNDIVIVMHDGFEKIKRVRHTRMHHVYLAGDNTSDSTDSRHFGWLSHDVVVGRVIWPKK